MTHSSNCYHCRKAIDLMEVFHEDDLRAIIGLSGSFDRHAHVVMGYCYLFGCSPLKLKAKKLRLLLEEMKRLFDAEAFTWERVKYSISRAGIAEALDVMVKRNFSTPLSNHNYLKQVMIDIAGREYQSKSRQGEKDLRKREGAAMSGGSYPLPEEQVEPPGRFKGDHNADASKMITPEPDAGKYLSREENLRRMSELTGKIGTISK